MSFGSRSIAVTGIEGEGPWLVTKYPSIGQGDEALAWQVFWRSNFLFGMRTSAAVVLDNRRSRKHLSLKFRVRCTIRDGSAQNRGVCVHESKCLKAIRRKCAGYIKSGLVNGDTDDEEGSIDKDKSSGTIDYCSSAVRRFFPCRSEDDAVLQTLREVQDIASNILSNESTLKFVGEDEHARCHSCEARTVGYSSMKSNPRSVFLHTLHHESIGIAVRDITCDICRCLLPFDGNSISLFALNKKHLLSR